MSKRYFSQDTDTESPRPKRSRVEFSTQKLSKINIMPVVSTTKTVRKYKKPKATSSSAKVSSAVKAYVQKEIKKNVEDKLYTTDLAGAVSGNANLILTPSTSTLPQYYSLIPTISQGTSEFTRIGNKIRLTKAEVEVQMLLSGAALTLGVDVPMNVYYFLLATRDSPDTLNSADLNQLLWANGAATQYLSGSGFANCHKLNNDYFNIAATNYPNSPLKIGYSQYDSTLYTNNDYSSNLKFKIDYTHACDKIIHFNNTGSTALNHNWYLCFYVQKQSLDTTTTNWDPPQVYVTQNLKFEDA